MIHFTVYIITQELQVRVNLVLLMYYDFKYDIGMVTSLCAVTQDTTLGGLHQHIMYT